MHKFFICQNQRQNQKSHDVVGGPILEPGKCDSFYSSIDITGFMLIYAQKPGTFSTQFLGKYKVDITLSVALSLKCY